MIDDVAVGRLNGGSTTILPRWTGRRLETVGGSYGSLRSNAGRYGVRALPGGVSTPPRRRCHSFIVHFGLCFSTTPSQPLTSKGNIPSHVEPRQGSSNLTISVVGVYVLPAIPRSALPQDAGSNHPEPPSQRRPPSARVSSPRGACREATLASLPLRDKVLQDVDVPVVVRRGHLLRCGHHKSCRGEHGGTPTRRASP